MFAGEEAEEVCVELGCLGKPLSAEKAAQPDKSKAGGEPVGLGFHATLCSTAVCTRLSSFTMALYNTPWRFVGRLLALQT